MSGGGGGRPTSPSGPLDDPGLMFRRLEQADTEEADHIKELFSDNLRALTGEAWLLNGLIDYYVSTGSARCLEILLSCGDGNSRALIDRLHQLLRSPDQRGAGLRLLGYYVRKHPVWLRKIVTQSSPSIVKDLFRIIKSECEVQCIISAALVLVTLMPMFPVALIDFIQDLFQVLSRLTQMVSSPSAHLSQTHQLHLHVATYSYFVRVYAMYPCNLLSYLRQHYGQRDSLPVFNRTIRPMLHHVRMHPLLVTGSNSTETSAQRWQRKETHDIVAECSHFSLDILEASAMDDLSGPLWSLPAHEDADVLGSTEVGLPDQEVYGMHDILWSPASFGGAARSVSGEQESSSSCETGVEATPDTTPAPTPTVTPQRDLENPPLLRPSTSAVQASRVLTALVGSKPPSAGTSDSTPTSPQKKHSGPFRFSDGDHHHHHSQPSQPHQPHPFSGRLSQVLNERADCGGGVVGHEERAAGPLEQSAGPAPAAAAISSLSGLRDRRTSGKLSPIKLKLGPVVSPVQFSEGPPAVTRPVPRPSGAAASGCSSGGPCRAAEWPDSAADHSAEDREVSDLTRLPPPAAAVSGALTPFASTTAQLTQAHPLRLSVPPAAAPAAIPGRSADREDDDSPPPAVGMAASLPQSRLDFDLVRHMTRYYSQHVLPSRQHRRTSSCPDVAALSAPAAAPVAARAPPPDRRADAGCQTEDTHHPAAYEHLLIGALPPAPAIATPQVSPSPHQLLREHMSQTAPNARLMHELLLYERYKREVHARRNRRLFDRTRATRRLEEENRALKKQVEVMSVDVAECQRQLQLVKRQAARASDEHRAASVRLEQHAAEQAVRAERLSGELEQQRRDAQRQADRLGMLDTQLQRARCQLLDTERQLTGAQMKAGKKAELEARVLELERRLLMVGQLRHPAPPADPAAGGDPWTQLEPPPPPGPAEEEARRRAEAVASGLEQQIRERDITISELRRLMETVRVRHHEQLQALEERYRASKQHLQTLETRLLMVPEPGGQRSNGAELPGPAGKAARADPGTADLLDAI